MRIALLLACLASACSASGSAAPDAAPAAGCVAITRSCDAVTAAFAAAGTSATITCDANAGTFTMKSSGVPPYTSNQSTPNAIDDQGWVVTLPLKPTCAGSTTDVVNSRGAIGFMINGVPFYGPQNANGQDAPTVEGATLDDCDGHADMQCAYHYHSIALCVFGYHDTPITHEEPDGHPALIGFALDGFPLYAENDNDPSPALDSCNGHTDTTRGYHYHVTAKSPYFVGCYVGSPVTAQTTDRGCN